MAALKILPQSFSNRWVKGSKRQSSRLSESPLRPKIAGLSTPSNAARPVDYLVDCLLIKIPSPVPASTRLEHKLISRLGSALHLSDWWLREDLVVTIWRAALTTISSSSIDWAQMRISIYSCTLISNWTIAIRVIWGQNSTGKVGRWLIFRRWRAVTKLPIWETTLTWILSIWTRILEIALRDDRVRRKGRGLRRPLNNFWALSSHGLVK